MKRNNDLKPDKIEENTYVTISIGSEMYGIDVMKVKEISGISEITWLPDTLPFMKGVINLRGTVVPLVDMRLKFHIEEKKYDKLTVIVIVEVRNRLIGMIVDSVSDVMEIPVSSVQDIPHFSAKIDEDAIRSIGHVNDRLIILIDVNRVLSSEEFELIEQRESLDTV